MRDVDKSSDAIAAAFQAGANQVVNVEFYTSELRKYRDQAREMAMKAASEKAGALSQAAGADTGCVLNISENSWSYFNGRNWWCWREQSKPVDSECRPKCGARRTLERLQATTAPSARARSPFERK